MEDMINLSRAPQQQWVAAEAPQIHTETPPKREIMSLPAMEANGMRVRCPCRPV
jgi:hypothetical protein